MKKLINSALKTALYLLELSDQATENTRDRIADRYSDARDQARDSYGVMADRVNNAARALRGEDTSGVKNVLMFVGGVGAGVALGLMFAPASGDETRRAIAQRFEGIGSKTTNSIMFAAFSMEGRNRFRHVRCWACDRVHDVPGTLR